MVYKYFLHVTLTFSQNILNLSTQLNRVNLVHMSGTQPC